MLFLISYAFHLPDSLQIKAESILASSFEEVLYLDSDNVPLRDPEYLFKTELYSGKGKPGVVFWPDINKDHRESYQSLSANTI